MKTLDLKSHLEPDASAGDGGWDPRLSFVDPGKLAAMQDAGGRVDVPGGYQTRETYSHLKNAHIDLGEADLTDRQLVAVTLVFYGGVKKKRAARAMKISSQALTEHVNAALKKIEKSLG